MAAPVLASAVADMLKVKHPVLLAGMAVVASPPLAAAVSNAGGLGVIGAGFPSPSPEKLRKMIAELHELLEDKTCFGVDLLIPAVGGSARKTNYDYTHGKMAEMIDIICESRCRLFVCAVGVPARWIVDKLHAANIPVMNMVGSPKHVPKALASGVDLICAQGYEGGGHTGEVATMVLIPQVVELCRGHRSPLTNGPVHVVAAGGISDGATVAASFALGAEAVWVGTRFVASEEATTTKMHKAKVVEGTSSDTIRTVIYTGRPARVYKTPYVQDWEQNRQKEIVELTGRGVLPAKWDLDQAKKAGKEIKFMDTFTYGMGQACGAIKEVLPAARIVEEMVADTARILSAGASRVATAPAARL